MKKRRKWLKRLLIAAIIIVALLTAVGLLFRDDGSMGGFISSEGEQEFMKVYAEAMAKLPVPTEEFWLETDFGQVKVYRFEEPETAHKTPLLLLPGKSAPTPMWEANLADFMRERPVYTIDLLGEPGMSRETARIETSADQGRWLGQVIDQLPAAKLYLLGLSFGGWSAVNVALYHPDKIVSLILVDPVYVFGKLPLKMILASIPASVPFVPQSTREKMLSYIAGGADVDEDVITAKLIETSMRTFKSKLPMPDKISGEQLASLRMPVLGILAENSTMHKVEKSLAFGQENLSHKGSKMVVFPGASHAINGEYPEELAAAVKDFLENVESTR